MFRSPWSRNLLGIVCSRKDHCRPPQRRQPVRLMVESLEERLTPSGGTVTQTAGSYTALTGLIGGDTNPSTNYVINITSNFRFASGGQVTISKLGSGSTLTIQGQRDNNAILMGNGSCLFDIASGQNVTLKNLTLTEGAGHQSTNLAQGGAILDNGGSLALSDVVVANNAVQAIQAQGGGIYVNGGSLILKDCTIQSDWVIGVPAAGAQAEGGGVFVTGPAAVQITDSVISNNVVVAPPGATGAGAGAAGGAAIAAAGGGLYVAGSGWNVTLTGDTLSGNKATGGAGGNGAAGGTTISTKANNGGAGGQGGTAVGAGAAFVAGSGANSNTLTILNDSSHPSTISDNIARGGSGGAGGAGGAPTSTGNNSNGGSGGLGGIAAGGGVLITAEGNLTVNIGNTTFYGNQALSGAGGAGGAAGTGGSGTAGTAGTQGSVGEGAGGGLAIGLNQTNDNVTMVNSTIAANTVFGSGSIGTAVSGGGGVFLTGSSSTNPTFTLDNNTITQNTISGGQTNSGAGIAFELFSPSGSPPPATSGNLSLYNNVIQSNGTGSSATDLDSFGANGNTLSDLGLTNATNNFIGTINPTAVSSTSNIVGNTQTQLGSAVGVDSKGNPTGGPIYYPLASGVKSIGYGTTNVLSTIADVEGTATATDAIGNAMPSTGPINLGAVQVVLPAITQQPSSQTVKTGANVSFTAAASGTPAPTVQWQVSTDGGQSWTNIAGATGTTLTLSNVDTSMSGHEYRAVFSNSGGDVSTNAVTLTVNAPPSPPAPPTLHVPPLLAFYNNLLGGVESINTNGTETITASLLGFPLLVSTFDSNGNLESVLFLGFNVTLVFELL